MNSSSVVLEEQRMTSLPPYNVTVGSVVYEYLFPGTGEKRNTMSKTQKQQQLHNVVTALPNNVWQRCTTLCNHCTIMCAHKNNVCTPDGQIGQNWKRGETKHSATLSNISYTTIPKKYGGGTQGDGMAHNHVCTQKQCVHTRWPNWPKLKKGWNKALSNLK